MVPARIELCLDIKPERRALHPWVSRVLRTWDAVIRMDDALYSVCVGHYLHLQSMPVGLTVATKLPREKVERICALVMYRELLLR